MKQYENIRSVITDITALGKYDELLVARAVKRAYQRLRNDSTMDMGIEYFNFIKTDFVKILPNMTATLPKDCDEVLKVGYLFDDMGRKEARYLGRRRFIHGKTPTIEFPLCTCDEDNTENATDLVNATTVEQADALTFHNIPQTAYSNQYFGAWYEHKAQMYPNGIYALDYENNRLNLDAGTDTAVGNYLVVEYKSTLNSNDYNYIPLIAFEALRAKAMELMGNQTDNWRKIYNQELNTIRAASQNITIDDVMQIVCGGRHLRFRG